MKFSTVVHCNPAMDISEPYTITDAAASASSESGPKVPAVFVAHANSISSAPGGLQICTGEYLETVRAAGFAPQVTLFEHDKRFLPRLRQRISRRCYTPQWQPALLSDVLRAAREAEARFIFLNLVNLAPLAPMLRAQVGQSSKIVLLSHGLESVDFVHSASKDTWFGLSLAAKYRLGSQVLQERNQRLEIDHVFCLAPFEAEIERWLGAKAVTWLPRTLPNRPPLSWSPHADRIGFVGTLDHPPNRDGLVRFLKALDPLSSRNLQFRLVGGPRAVGEELAESFRTVRYLGHLSDEVLDREAATWSCFVHPLFCYARGCSTKLAVALSWQIPIATTPAGCRGYVWREGALPLAETPETLARLTVRLTQPQAGLEAREQVKAIAGSMPGINEVAVTFRNALLKNGTD